MASKRKTDYSKQKLIRYLRALADSGKSWQDMQKDILPSITCIGDLYPLRDGAPENTPRHARQGTSLDRTQIRHALRDICRCVAMLDEVSNKVLDEAWRDRAQAQAEYREFAGVNGNWGQYHTLCVDIEKLKSAATRVAKIGVLDDEKRRLCAVAYSASNRFALIEEKHFFFNQTRKRYPGSFPEIHDWTPPAPRDPADTRRMIEVEIDSVDWDAVPFDDSEIFYIEHVSGKYLGNTQLGLLFFRSYEAAGQYIEGEEMLSVSQSVMFADRVRDTVLWFADHHRFVTKLPNEGLWLFEQHPELLNTQPRDDRELTEGLEAANTAAEVW